MPNPHRVLHLHLETGKAETLDYGDKSELLGGSHLAAALYQQYGDARAAWDDPNQPVIFAVGPLTGYFPLMSKVVCGFRSPYHGQYCESHAGGRLALAIRFAGFDALMLTGCAPTLSMVVAGSRSLEVKDVHYLRNMDVLAVGRHLRQLAPSSHGHRSLMRIGPAAENRSAYGCINVDTYRHFGRMGAGTALGVKNVKGVMVLGDGDFNLPDNAEYAKLYKHIYQQVTATHMMSKYHDLGTPQNLIPLNELKSLPWRNLQATSDPGVEGVSGEKFAQDLLLRNAACSGCPVGCIHIGLLREQFAAEHQFKYRQVGYDYELIFAVGTMLGVTDASDSLALMDEVEKAGFDCMSAGVALAWATEAYEKGLVTEEQTLTPLAFGDAPGYLAAINLMAKAANDFYKALGQGALAAAMAYGGQDFACVLGQEMAGYATGEVFFAQQAHSFRHSHLDAGGYSYDQTNDDQDVDKAVNYLVADEQGRVLLTSMVSCLFARGVYKDDPLADCLRAVNLQDTATNMHALAASAQKLRWKVRLSTGYDPAQVKIPKRFTQVETWKGKIDPDYMRQISQRYRQAITTLAE